METNKIEEVVLKRVERQGWAFNPDKELRSIMEELGEVSREVRRLEDGRERPDEEEPSPEEIKKEIASEIGDLIFAIVKLAHCYDITIDKAFEIHREKMNERYGGNI